MVIEKISKLDTLGALKAYSDWPEHCNNAWSLEVDVPTIGRVENVVLGGMGGSAAAADMIMDLSIDKMGVPVTVVKDYEPPGFLGKNTLAIVTSCSGDTEEAISLAQIAFRKEAYLTTISGGGKLQKFSQSNGIPYTKTKKIIMPRISLPYLLYPALKILNQCKLIKVVDEVRDSLKSLSKVVALSETLHQNKAVNLAKFLAEGFPMIYASRWTRAVAIRAKDCLNENSKLHAAVEIMPELCHNEIEGWGMGSQPYVKPVFLRSRSESRNIAGRFEILKEIISDKGFEVKEIYGEGSSHLSEIVTSTYIMDLASIFLAFINMQDPSPTPLIQKLKESLASKRERA